MVKNSRSRTSQTLLKPAGNKKKKIVRVNPPRRKYHIVKKDVPQKERVAASETADKIKQYGKSIIVKRIPENGKKTQDEDVKYMHFTNEWSSVKEVRGGIIITFDSRYIKILEVMPINYWQLETERKETIINKFTSLSLASPTKFMLKMVTDSVDISGVINHVREVNENVTNPLVKKAESQYIEHMESLREFAGLDTRYFYIFEYEKQSDEGIRNDFETIWNSMNSIETDVRDTFEMCGNEVVYHDPLQENEWQLETLYKYFNKRSSKIETFEDRVNRLQYDAMMYSDSIGKEKTYELSDFISAKGIDLSHKDLVRMDGTYYAFLTIKDNGFPNYLAGGWLDHYIQGRGIDVTVSCRKQSKALVEAVLPRKRGWDQDMSKSRFLSEERRARIFQSIRNTQEISSHLNLGEELIKTVTTFTFWGDNPKEIFKKRNDVARKLKKNGFATERAEYDLDQYLANTSPLLTFSNPIFRRNGHDMLSSSLATFYNYTRHSMFDASGVVIGRTANSIAAINNYNTKKYKNANMDLFGTPGAGKTFTELLFSRRSYLTGIATYFILPVKAYEYEPAVKSLGGVFARLVPGSDTCLNICGIYPEKSTEDDDEDVMEYSQQSLLTKKIKSLITFFELRNGGNLSNAQRSQLDTLFTEMYSDYGITNDNNSIFDADGSLKIMPTLKTIYDKAMEKPELFGYLTELLNSFVKGQYKNFVGQTNIDISNKCIAFDCNEREIDKHDLPSIMYIIQDFCVNMAILNDGFTDIFGDELWKVLQTESSAEQLQMMSKVLRGYGGALIVATQEINDMAENKYGRSILNNAKIKLVLNVEENEFDIIKDIVGLTKQDYNNHISAFKQGQALFVANGLKVPISIVPTQEEYDLFTTDKNDKIKRKKTKIRN